MAYNPYAYVPGGADTARNRFKAQTIQDMGYGLPVSTQQATEPYVAPTPPQVPISGQAAIDYYTGLAHGTAGYVTGSQALNARRDRNSLTAAEQIRQNLASFGIIPDEFQDPYGWVNNETRQLAQAGTAAGTSTFARLQQAQADAARRSKRALAARGMARSGQMGYNLDRQALAGRQNYTDAVGKLLGANRGIYSDYQSEFDRIADAWRQLEGDAYGSVNTMALPTVPGATPPPPPQQPPPTQAPVYPTYFPPSRPPENPIRGGGLLPV